MEMRQSPKPRVASAFLRLRDSVAMTVLHSRYPKEMSNDDNLGNDVPEVRRKVMESMLAIFV